MNETKQKSKAMTVKKYTRFSKLNMFFKKIQNKKKNNNMQVSLRSNCFAHSYFKA